MPARIGKAHVLRYEERAEDCFLVELERPQSWQDSLPGQFVNIRLPLFGCEPLLRRPLSVYDEDERTLRLLIRRLHGFTRRLHELLRTGALPEVDILGPLGKPFETPPADVHIMIGGGIGVAALGLLAHRLAESQPASARILLHGVRDAGYVGLSYDFSAWGCDVRIATEDGSTGRQGLVTALCEELAIEAGRRVMVYTCGPNPMLSAVARWLDGCKLDGQVCVEELMCCGIGVCLSCVVPVRNGDGGWNWIRSCTDGPVFDAKRIAWEMVGHEPK